MTKSSRGSLSDSCSITMNCASPSILPAFGLQSGWRDIASPGLSSPGSKSPFSGRAEHGQRPQRPRRQARLAVRPGLAGARCHRHGSRCTQRTLPAWRITCQCGGRSSRDRYGPPIHLEDTVRSITGAASGARPDRGDSPGPGAGRRDQAGVAAAFGIAERDGALARCGRSPRTHAR